MEKKSVFEDTLKERGVQNSKMVGCLKKEVGG